MSEYAQFILRDDYVPVSASPQKALPPQPAPAVGEKRRITATPVAPPQPATSPATGEKRRITPLPAAPASPQRAAPPAAAPAAAPKAPPRETAKILSLAEAVREIYCDDTDRAAVNIVYQRDAAVPRAYIRRNASGVAAATPETEAVRAFRRASTASFLRPNTEDIAVRSAIESEDVAGFLVYDQASVAVAGFSFVVSFQGLDLPESYKLAAPAAGESRRVRKALINASSFAVLAFDRSVYVVNQRFSVTDRPVPALLQSSSPVLVAFSSDSDVDLITLETGADEWRFSQRRGAIDTKNKTAEFLLINEKKLRPLDSPALDIAYVRPYLVVRTKDAVYRIDVSGDATTVFETVYSEAASGDAKRLCATSDGTLYLFAVGSREVKIVSFAANEQGRPKMARLAAEFVAAGYEFCDDAGDLATNGDFLEDLNDEMKRKMKATIAGAFQSVVQINKKSFRFGVVDKKDTLRIVYQKRNLTAYKNDADPTGYLLVEIDEGKRGTVVYDGILSEEPKESEDQNAASIQLMKERIAEAKKRCLSVRSLRAALPGEDATNFLLCSWNLLFAASADALIATLVSRECFHLLSVLAYSALYAYRKRTDEAFLLPVEEVSVKILDQLERVKTIASFETALALLAAFFDETMRPQTKVARINGPATPEQYLAYVRCGAFGYTEVTSKYTVPPRRIVVRSAGDLAATYKARLIGELAHLEFSARRVQLAESREGVDVALETTVSRLRVLRNPVVSIVPRVDWRMADLAVVKEFVGKYHPGGVQPVEVRKSTIEAAGNGLFATRDIPQHTPIAVYYGGLFETAKIRANDRYAMGLSLFRNVDGEDEELEYVISGEPKYLAGPKLRLDPPRDSPAVFANDAKGNGSQNATLIVYYLEDRHEVFGYISSINRNIRAGEEIFVEYGEEYWNRKHDEEEAEAEAEEPEAAELSE